MVDRYGNPSVVITPNVLRLLEEQGLRRVNGYTEGASQWCTGSGSFPDADPPHDSHGDCTECGEPLIWVVLDG